MTQFTPLRSQLDNWTLEDDSKCFLTIQNFTQSFMNKANEIQNSFKDTEYNINTFKAMVNNNFSKLSNLQNQKFTENKMAPANDEELLFSKSNNNANDLGNENLTEVQLLIFKYQKKTALAQKYKDAVASGMKSMNVDSYIDQNADGNDDAISLTGGANDEKMSQFSQFTHIPTKHNKLPCVIGTSNFYNDPYLGIIELDDQIIAKSQVQDLTQSQQIGFAPTQTVIPEIQIQQSTVVQDQQQQQQQFASNPAAPQAPSLDLLLQGAATKKNEPTLPQVNIQPPPLNNNSIQFDYNKIDESVMLQQPKQPQQGQMQESVAIQNPAPVERQSVQKKVRKPMFEDFSSSSDEGEKQQQDQEPQQQEPAPVKVQPQALSIQDAFMMKLRKMQETKDTPEQQQQTFQPPPEKPRMPILESKIEAPTIINQKGNNLFDEDKEETVVKPPIYQPIIEKNEEPTQKKGMEMFGDDDDDQDETYEAFLKRETKQQQMKKFGSLLVDEDENQAIG